MCLFIGPHIRLPLPLDAKENVVQLIQLLIRVLWFRVNRNHHQVLQHCGGHTKHTVSYSTLLDLDACSEDVLVHLKMHPLPVLRHLKRRMYGSRAKTSPPSVALSSN